MKGIFILVDMSRRRKGQPDGPVPEGTAWCTGHKRYEPIDGFGRNASQCLLYLRELRKNRYDNEPGYKDKHLKYQREYRARRLAEDPAFVVRESNRSRTNYQRKRASDPGFVGRIRQNGISRRENLDKWFEGVAIRHLGSSDPESTQFLKELLQSQSYTCPYFGFELIPGRGGNCHLDHKSPKSRFPEQAMDRDNLQWLCEPANRLKHTRTDKEMRGLLASLHGYAESNWSCFSDPANS